ncbi:MAG: S8 family serine peptidase, partial [Planctomycetota bacterium]
MLTRKTILTIVIVVSTCWATPANALYPPPDATCDALPGLTGQVAPDTVPPEPAYKPGGLLVRFAPKANGKQRSKAEKEAFLASIGAGSIKRPYHLVPGLTHVKLPGGLTVDNALKRFKGRREILYAEPNYEVYALATPNDPNFSDQWGMHNTGQTGGTSDADIDAPEAWDLETDANEIVVAVIDTGVDYNHPDLTANMWTDANGCHGYDFVNDDNDPMDDHFHGTHCAGIIGAVGDNNTGVTGVCWNVKIMALKFLDDEASGTTANAIAAIEYAVDNGGDVLSNSWGGTYYSQPLKDAIEAADANSLLFVAAAGNDSMNNDILPVYPSCYDCNNIIAVMSTDHNDEKSSFSNYGPTSVDLGAPGTDILSTFPTYVTSAMQSAGFSTYYETISGTSMAAPHLAGACALAWSEHPTLTHLEIKDILSQWTDELEALDGLCVSNGRLNLYAAVGNKKVNNLSQRKWYDKIQDAIDEANDLDIIRVWPATYYETIDFNQVAVTVRSYNPENPDLVADTIIDGNNSDANIVTFRSSANSILAGFTITGGARGIYCSESSPTIDNCVIEDNNHCGVYGYNSTAAVIRNNQIRQNTYYGVYLAYSSATVKNNWIYDNGSYGIDTYDSGLTVIRNNTIVGNSTAGVYVAHGNEPNIANCILWNNNDDLYNCSATYSCIQDGDSGTGNISSDPCFVDADANDFHLDINSPCINTGDPNGDYTAEKDIDGHPRVMAATVDMGADEFSRIFNLEQEKWYDNIQDAIDDANRNENETIEVGPNRYYENIDFNGVPCILTGVDPNDWAVVAATIIDANGSGTVVTFDSNEDANSVLAGFTITGGADKYSIGGGVYCYQTSPTITHCLITGNSAEKGGGIGTKENQSAVNVAHCNFTGNSAETGGGMYVRYGSATLTDCNLTYNRAEYMGGGFRNSRGSVTFANCAVRSNLSEYGGGVYTGGYATFEASNCTFKNNVADWDEGGGLYNAGALTASNCTFEDNRAVCPGYGFGGAVANNGESGGHANITGCYFSQNQAAR